MGNRALKCFEVRGATCSESPEPALWFTGAGVRAELGRVIREANLFSKSLCPSAMEMVCDGSTLLIVCFGEKMGKTLTLAV